MADSAQARRAYADAGVEPTTIRATEVPYSQTRPEVHSTPRPLAITAADERGRVATGVGIPHDLEDGRHTLEVAGVDASHRPRVVRAAFEIDRPFRPSPLGWIAGLSAISPALGVVVILVSGRRAPWRRRPRVTARGASR